MVVLITGATGFIGRRLVAALSAAGHRVIEARRRPRPGSLDIAADFTSDLDPRDWTPKLGGVNVVVNAVGILREHGEQTFDRVHTQAPRALFAACAAAGVRRVVQISALGAAHGSTRYFTSKRAADEYLATLPLEWSIVQPSLVYGEGGASAHLFTMLASAPLIPLPAGGEQQVQPIHIDDLIAALVSVVSAPDAARRVVPLVGPHPLSLRDLLITLRAAMGLPAAPCLPIPRWLMRLGATFGELSSRSMLDRETLAMLEMGNTADAAMTHRLLQRAPREAAAFIARERRELIASNAKLAWLLPLLRFSIAAVWLWTGLVSLGLYPRDSSYELLARTGVPAALFPWLLYGAAALDLALGVATLALRERRVLWLVQIGLILAYTAIITVRLPEYWLHPYGPVLKNLPMLAAIYALYTLEQRRR